MVDYDSYVNSGVTMKIVEIDGMKFDDVIQSNQVPLFDVFLLDEQNGEMLLNLSYDKISEIIGEHYVIVQVFQRLYFVKSL